jgi:hypothetical protein
VATSRGAIRDYNEALRRGAPLRLIPLHQVWADATSYIQPPRGDIHVRFRCELPWHGLYGVLTLHGLPVSSRVPLAVKMELKLESVGHGAGIGPDDYVDDAHLPRIIALLKEKMRWVAKKAEEWRRKAKLYSESTTMECMYRFCRAVVLMFGPDNMRTLNEEDTVRILAQNEERGFPS